MRDPELTKNLIISKATSLFNTQGYRATSISDITKATGMTKGAIYGNFENKDAVAEASYHFASSKIMTQLGDKIRSAPTAPLKLKFITSYFSEYAYNSPIEGGCPIINTAIEADDNHPNLRMKVVESMAMIKESIKKIINRGIVEGQMKKDIDVEGFANTFYASITGAILISRAEGNTVTYNHVRKSLDRQIDELSI